MRKLLIGLTALIAFGATGAMAQDRGHRGGFGGGYGGQGRYERGGYPGGGGYGPSSGYFRAPYAANRGYPSPHSPYGSAPGASSGYRGYSRGQFLPPSYLGGVVDPRQYHLRRPPNGYGWVTVGPNAYLTQRSTGLILDTAPLY
jgi:Ni/Co efflux regulator RcnB